MRLRFESTKTPLPFLNEFSYFNLGENSMWRGGFSLVVVGDFERLRRLRGLRLLLAGDRILVKSALKTRV